ncbi:MAG: dTMP kinase [Armatimonadetes bacterium]|nr:MAG: dTMP kinase [Armatimonadota bacterium]GIV02369.1 MAG: hypothetical protein KatS3mg015_1199 [Fimbriimonadales bacterium]
MGERVGRFITVEGPDGAGKSTLARAIAEQIEAAGESVVLTREPGDSPIGAAVRALLLDGDDLDRWTEAFLFLADRREHCLHVIRPALLAGKWVVCDRFADSTVAYQGYGAGLDVSELRSMNELATAGLRPDATILLDLDPQVALQRLSDKNRLDRMPLDYHERVREGFLTESRLDPDRWIVLDASRPPEEVRADALRLLAERFAFPVILSPGGDPA